jgi:hypothetical protein
MNDSIANTPNDGNMASINDIYPGKRSFDAP